MDMQKAAVIKLRQEQAPPPMPRWGQASLVLGPEFMETGLIFGEPGGDQPGTST